MRDIRNRLDEYVIGQDDAKDQIIDALARTMIPNPNRKKPIANLVFLGPT
jgi:ATP-dependent Clp protease ATP-binding subunit ClpA